MPDSPALRQFMDDLLQLQCARRRLLGPLRGMDIHLAQVLMIMLVRLETGSENKGLSIEDVTQVVGCDHSDSKIRRGLREMVKRGLATTGRSGSALVYRPTPRLHELARQFTREAHAIMTPAHRHLQRALRGQGS